MNRSIKPTVREVRVALANYGHKLTCRTFNDKRKNGGRIKLWKHQKVDKLDQLSAVEHAEVLGHLKHTLQVMFPQYGINVCKYMNSTVIHYKNK